jgi:hypothetical protein
MNIDPQKESGQQNQPSTQKLNDQQQRQGQQQAWKPDATKAPEAAGTKSPGTEGAKN